MAVAPELVVPVVAFDELVRVSGDESVTEFGVAEFCFEYLFHDKQPDVSPIGDDSNFSTASLGDQWRLGREDPRTFGWVVGFERLIRVFGCRVDAVADADRQTVEVAEKVRGASKIINQVLLFCRRDGSPFEDTSLIRRDTQRQRNCSPLISMATRTGSGVFCRSSS